MTEIIHPGQTDIPKAEPGDERFYSVTTVLKAMDKPALQYWSAEMTAKAAVQIAPILAGRIEAEGEASVIEWLCEARFRPAKGKRTASEMGTAVHDAAEQYALTGTRPATDDQHVSKCLDQLEEWFAIWQPTYEAAEAAVYNRTMGYAGTLDAIAVVDGMRVLVDYKSSDKSVDKRGNPTGPYPEVALQLAAYRYAELMATFRARRFEQWKRRYYLLNEVEVETCAPMPQVDGAIVLHITPEHCHAYPVRCDEEIFDSFCYVQEVFRFQQTLAKNVIGSPLMAKVSA